MNTQVAEPTTIRAAAFFDGQNLYYAAKEAFGYKYPNYDPLALSNLVCGDKNWTLAQVRFYTGIPDPTDDALRNRFWTAKLSHMGRQGVRIFTRPLRYRNQTVGIRDGVPYTVLVGREKGIDVRIALDVVRLARENAYDVALIFSQDQDLSEAADEIRLIAKEQSRWIKAACAYPVSPAALNKRGINQTEWIKIERKSYDLCLDSTDYRPKPL